MSARVPAESLAAVRAAVVEAADSVQYQSYYVNDVSSDYQNLLERQADLIAAQDRVWSLTAGPNDSGANATYRIVRELLDAELKNVEGQLDSYRQQAAMASLDISMNQPTEPQPTIIE